MPERNVDLRLDEICTREDVASTYERSDYAEKAVAFLDEHGIFPLNYANPQLVHLNTLGLYVYYSGFLRMGRQGTARISMREGQHDLTDVWTERLGLTFDLSPGEVAFGENGSLYGRLLHVMGFHTSNGTLAQRHRKGTGSVLPAYLTHLIDEHADFTWRCKSKVNRYLHDLLSVFFDTRAQLRDRYLAVNLVSQPSEELMMRSASQLVTAVNILYPEVGLDMEDVIIRRDSAKRLWYGLLRIPFEKALRFPQFGLSPVKVKLEVKPRFSFEHPMIKE